MHSRTRTAWLFLTPMIVLMLIVAVWPLARSIWFSFTDTNINDISAGQWVGLENYFGEYGLFFNPNDEEGFWSGDWGISIRNTFGFAVVSVVLETLTGLGVALLLNQDFKGRALVRTAVLVPWAIPTIVSAKMWGWMLNDQFGVINTLLLNAGLISSKIAWTAEPSYALWTVVLVDGGRPRLSWHSWSWPHCKPCPKTVTKRPVSMACTRCACSGASPCP